MTRKLLMAVIFGLLVLAAQSGAHAQGVAWVSPNGTDPVSPTSSSCTDTAPCKTFAAAMTAAGAGGEIDCLGPGIYATGANSTAALTISAALTINCAGGVVLVERASTGIGIIVDSFPVTLRGLEILGVGGSNGDFSFGVFVQGGTAALEDVRVSGCDIGVVVEANGGGNKALLSASRVTAEKNSTAGIAIAGLNGGTSEVHLVDSVISGNGGDGIVLGSGVPIFAGNPTAGGLQFLTVQRSSIVMNSGSGIDAENGREGKAFVLIGASTVAWNATGMSVSGGAVVFSYRDNQINGNGTDIGGTVNTVPLQ
jgi:hypothetical protein